MGVRASAGSLAESPVHLVTVQVRQHHVEDDRIRRRLVGRLERRLTAERRRRLEPSEPEVDLEQAEDHRIVVDEEHARHRRA